MLTLNNKKNGVKNYNIDLLTCDLCNSNNIVETKGGFVCKDCGIILEIEKLEYYAPYKSSSLQHARLNEYTNIGSLLERFNNPHSSKLKRFQKQQLILEDKKRVIQQARIEIGRIFSASNYPNQLKEEVFELFKELRKKIKERSKYRSVEKLVPISIYLFFKLKNFSINEFKLLEVSKITKQDFNAFKLQVYQFLPEYKKRNRENYVQRKIFELMEQFNLEMGFYFRSQKILAKLWNGIKNTSDLVIAGVVSSISLLCSDPDQRKVPINALCNHLGIRMSTIQSQVKNKIFNQFNISGFVSLIKSSSVLKKIMVKLGVIEENNSELKLGNAVQVFNCFDDQNYYAYLIATNSKLISFTYRKEFNFKSTIVSNCSKIVYEQTVMNFYSLGIGPPTMDSG